MAARLPQFRHAFASPRPNTIDPTKIGSARWNELLSFDLGSVLTPLLSLDIAANKLPFFTAVDGAALTDFTSFGRSIAALQDAAAARALFVALNKAGDAMTGPLAMGGNRITGLGAPTTNGDAATKDYVDALTTGAALFQDGWDASSGVFPNGTANKGWWWLCTTAGTVGGQAFSVGDSVYARINNPGTGTYAGKWQILQGSLTLAEIQTAIGFTFGSLASASSITASLISDASANGRSLITAADFPAMKTLLAIAAADITDFSANGRSLATAANYAAMKTLLGITAADISNASANGRSLITAANYPAMKTLLAIASTDVSGLGSLATLSAVTASLISDASANGRSLMTAANYPAMKVLLAIAAGDVSGLGSLATASSVTASQISDATANGRSFMMAANYAAMKGLLGITQADVSGLTTADAPAFAGSTMSGLLKFYGATNLCPALKRSSAGLQVRLADDSAFAVLEAATASASDNSNKVATTAYVDAAVAGAGGFTEASDAEMWAATATGKGVTPRRAASAKAWIAATDASTVAIDSTVGRNFKWTQFGNRTLGFPSGTLKEGDEFNYLIKQDGTGSRTLAYAAGYVHDGDTAQAIGTTAGKYSLLCGKVLPGAASILIQLIAVNFTGP